MPVSKTEIRTWLPLGKINANVVAKVQILHTEGRSRVDKTGVWWASVRHFSQGFAHILHVQVHPPCRQMTRVTDVHCWVAQPFLVTSPDDCSGWAMPKEGDKTVTEVFATRRVTNSKEKNPQRYYYYTHERSWGDKQEVLNTRHLTVQPADFVASVWKECTEKRWTDKQQLLQEGGSPFSAHTIPPPLTFSLTRPLPQQRFISLSLTVVVLWRMGILRRGRLRSASTLSFLPCPACSFLNSKVQSTIPKMSRIYLWGRQQRKRKGSNRVVNSANREWGEPSFILLHVQERLVVN